MYGLKLALFIAFAMFGSYGHVHAFHLPMIKNITLLPPVYRIPVLGGEDYSILNSASVLKYHGGKVLTGPVNLFAIFYGHWPNSSMNIITDFLSNFSSTPTFEVLKSYYDITAKTKHYIDGPVTLLNVVVDQYSEGHTLSSELFFTLIRNHIHTFGPNNIYLFFPSVDVILTDNYCTTYCSYYMGIEANVGGKLERVAEAAVVPDPLHCMLPCAREPNLTVSPNGQPSIDAMISDIAAILSTIFADPRPDGKSGWSDDQGIGAGIKCDGITGPVMTLEDGAKWNAAVGNKRYLLFETWDIKEKQCRL